MTQTHAQIRCKERYGVSPSVEDILLMERQIDETPREELRHFVSHKKYRFIVELKYGGIDFRVVYERAPESPIGFIRTFLPRRVVKNPLWDHLDAKTRQKLGVLELGVARGYWDCMVTRRKFAWWPTVLN